MTNIDWMQFETLSIICIGAYLLFEVVRAAVLQSIRIYSSRDTEKRLYNTTNIFSVLRILLIASIVITFIFTGVFNRQRIAKPHSDLGHQNNIKTLQTTNPKEIEAKIKAKEQAFKKKTLEQINRESENNYEIFLQQTQKTSPSGEKQ